MVPTPAKNDSSLLVIISTMPHGLHWAIQKSNVNLHQLLSCLPTWQNWWKLQVKLEFSIQNWGKLQVKLEFCQVGNAAIVTRFYFHCQCHGQV